MRVVVIGDINLDILSFVNKFPCDEESIHPKKILIRPGGAALNTALSLYMNSINVTLIGALGKDVIGDFIIKKIEKLIDVSFIQRVNTTTGIIYALVKRDKKSMIGFKGANNFLSFEKKWITLLEKADAIHISPYLFTSKNGFKIFRNLKDILREKITTFSLSKILIERRKIFDILNVFSYVFMNEEEAKIFTKKEKIEEMRKVLIKNMKRAIITRGKEGAVYMDKERFVEVKGREGEIVNPVGAGDFFVGGFIYGILNKLSIEESLKKGVEVSYKFVSTPYPDFWEFR